MATVKLASRRTQATRLIGIETPLGKDALLLRIFKGEEGISRLFRFELELLAEDPAVDFPSILGKAATVRLMLGDQPRFFNGLISRISQVPGESSLLTLEAEMVPWTWLLTRTTDCRIFQNLSVPQIVEKVCKDQGFQDVASHLQKTYPPREYCVQYRETDFNFISRLLEQEGIFFYYQHENGKHTLVLADTPAEHQPAPGGERLRFQKASGKNLPADAITALAATHELRPGKYALGSFNFETPFTNLTVGIESVRKPSTGATPEIYDFPGGHLTRSEGERLVRTRIEEEEAQMETGRGESTCRGLTSGYTFEVTGHPRKEANQPYVATWVKHRVIEHGYYTGSKDADLPAYVNQFTCLPASVPFRPRRLTPKPVMTGPQTAIVVGKKEEEIWVDRFGRVKVQFHWDREGKRDENSSCWMRVAQLAAGKRWGTLFVPRVGQEVIVEFLEGDPDQPIVTGRVYNASNMPPYALPGEQTKTTIKSSTSKGGGGSNELRFDDKAGAEHVFLHGQHDLDLVVENQTRELAGKDRHLVVEGSRLEQVTDEMHLKIGGHFVREVGGTESIQAGQELYIRAGMRVFIESPAGITLRAAGGFVKIDASGVTVHGTDVRIKQGGDPGSAGPIALRLPQRATGGPGTGGAGDEGEATEVDPAWFTLVVQHYDMLYEQNKASMTPEQRARAEALLAKLKSAAASGDKDALAAAAQELHTHLETATGKILPPPPGFDNATVVDGKTILGAPTPPLVPAGAGAAAGPGGPVGAKVDPNKELKPVSRARVKNWRGAIALESGFMTIFYPTWDDKKRAQFRQQYKANRYTHVVVTLGATYGPQGSFDWWKTPERLEPFLRELLADDLIPVFCGANSETFGSGDVHSKIISTWQRVLPPLADLLPAAFPAYEMNDFLTPVAQAEVIKALRRFLPKAYIGIHFTRDRPHGDAPRGSGPDGPLPAEWRPEADENNPGHMRVANANFWNWARPYADALLYNASYTQLKNVEGRDGLWERLGELSVRLPGGDYDQIRKLVPWLSRSPHPPLGFDLIFFEGPAEWLLKNQISVAECKRIGRKALEISGVSGFGDHGE